MKENDTHLDDLIREHYASRQLRPGRLAALEESLASAPRTPPHRRGRLTRRAAVRLAACVALSAASGAVLALAGVHGLGGFEPAIERGSAPDIIAVQFYAEWCKPSQVVAKHVKALQEDAADKSVLFVRLDLTDDTRREQAQLLMSSLGCGDIWDTQRGRTGELLLIDGHTMRPITKLNNDSDTEQMFLALTQALAQAAIP